MRKIYIDCGAHIGNSIKLFKNSEEYSEDFEIFAFEPIPKFARHLKKIDGITFINKAVWVMDGQTKMYEDKKHDTASGSSLYSNKTSGFLDRENPLNVDMVDFAKWIKDNFSPEDYIIIKMDIEGAEYPVISWMQEVDAMKYVNKMYVEFHYQKMGEPKSDFEDLHQHTLQIFEAENTPELLGEMKHVIT